MTDEIRAFLRAKLSPGDTALCAVSGGPDSMALLRAMESVSRELQLSLACAHFHHGLRDAADADADFVKDYCASRGIAFFLGRADLAAEKRPGESVEEAARRLRYAFLESVRPDAYLLTAHTADDNLETMLMHLLRGASLRGLAGIPPARGRILRPMLGLTRADVLDYLKKTATPYRTDETNASDDYLRNRIRHHVIPFLTAENPSVAKTAQAAGLRLREEDAVLSSLAQQALCTARVPDGLSCAALAAHPDAILRRALLAFLRESGAAELSARQVEAALALVRSGDPGAAVSLCGGRTLRREYDLLTLAPAPEAAFEKTQLNVPGVTILPALGLRISCKTALWRESDEISASIAVHYTGGPVFVRPRRTGDVIGLPGGRRSLKKLMIDRKIPAAQRGFVPVFEDETGIAAVCGLVDQSRLPRAGAPALYIQIEKDGYSNEHS